VNRFWTLPTGNCPEPESLAGLAASGTKPRWRPWPDEWTLTGSVVDAALAIASDDMISFALR
jgi:hypothetical protein